MIHLSREIKTLYTEDAFDVIGNMVFMIDSAGILRMINKKGCDILEVDRKKVLGLNWFDFFVPSDTKELMRSIFADAVRTKYTLETFENEIISLKGRKYIMLWYSSPLIDDEGAVAGILCSGQDVTEQRIGEYNLITSEEKYRALVNNISQVVFDVSFKEDDLEAAYPKQVLPAFVSGRVIDLTGYTSEEFITGAVIYQPNIHPDDRDDAIRKFWKMIEDKHAVIRTYRFRHKTGVYKWFEDNLIPRLDSEGKINGWFGTVTEITERKGLEAAIEDYEKFFHLSLDLFCIAGIDGYFKKVNPSFERVLGYFENELLDTAFFNFVHPDDLEKTKQELVNLSRGIPTVSFENRYRCKDGSYKWLSWNSSPAVNRNLVFAVARDISDKKEYEEQIRRSEAFLNSVVENIPSMIFVKDARDLKFVRFNKAGEELLGFPREEMLGKNDYDFFLQKEADFFTKKDREVLKKGALVDIKGEEIRTRHKGIRVLHTRKIPLVDATGKPEYLLGISEDITEAIKAQEELRKSEEKYRDIVHLIQEGIWMVDSESKTTFVNEEMAKILNYTREEMLGRHLFEFMDAEGLKITKKMIQRRKKGIEETFDFKFKTKEGEDRWTILNTRPIMDSKGKYLGAIAAVVDVTERRKQEEIIKENEQKLKDAQKIANVGSWEFYVATKEVKWSDETYRIFGVDPKKTAVTRELFWSHVHPDDRELLKSSIDAALHQGIPYEIELRLLLRDGYTRYTFNRGRAITKDGKVIKLVGTTMDVTSKKIAETQEIKALVTGQDMERQRIAEDLHDSLGQKLSAIKLFSQKLIGTDKNGSKREIFKLEKGLDEAIEEVRNISHNLMPSSLTDFGIVNTLKNLCSSLANPKGISVSFQAFNVKRKIDSSIEFGIYRIAQELLTNALRHANAKKIDMQLFEREKKLILTVEDDGRGFRAKKTNFENTFGMNSITSRTKALNGIFSIDSQPGKGTMASIEIPLKA